MLSIKSMGCATVFESFYLHRRFAVLASSCRSRGCPNPGNAGVDRPAPQGAKLSGFFTVRICIGGYLLQADAEKATVVFDWHAICIIQGIKVPASQLLRLRGTLSAASNVYEPTSLHQKLHADMAMCEESRAGLLLMLGISPTAYTDPILPEPADSQYDAPPNIECSNIEPAPQAAFEILRATADSWDFDALEFEAATGGNGLVTMDGSLAV